MSTLGQIFGPDVARDRGATCDVDTLWTHATFPGGVRRYSGMPLPGPLPDPESIHVPPPTREKQSWVEHGQRCADARSGAKAPSPHPTGPGSRPRAKCARCGNVRAMQARHLCSRCYEIVLEAGTTSQYPVTPWGAYKTEEAA